MPHCQPVIDRLKQESSQYNRIYVSSIHLDLSENDVRASVYSCCFGFDASVYVKWFDGELMPFSGELVAFTSGELMPFSGELVAFTSGELMPFSGELMAFSSGELMPFSGDLMAFTSGELMPFSGELTPFGGKLLPSVPFSGELTPFSGELTSFSGELMHLCCRLTTGRAFGL